mmetsp:Transcript_7165/g.9298  ORF Transcript_7165/g.9298 Transcript_7165/m.9298 type:complete len:81 (-) Transcript_7165:437-679(-)
MSVNDRNKFFANARFFQTLSFTKVFLRIERSFGRWKHKFRISFNVEHSKIIEDFCYRPLISYLRKMANKNSSDPFPESKK